MVPFVRGCVQVRVDFNAPSTVIATFGRW